MSLDWRWHGCRSIFYLLVIVILAACGGNPKAVTHAREATSQTVDSTAEEASEIAHSFGKFVRFELVTHEPHKAAQFYQELLQWNAQSADADADADAVYNIYNNGRFLGRIRKFDVVRKLPQGWVSWISVESVDEVIRDVKVNGGRLVESERQVLHERRALVAGPTGGTFGIVRADGGDDPEDHPRQGDWFWSQLWTRDFDTALAFYTVVGSYTSVEYRFGHLRYRVLEVDGVPRAAIVKAPSGRASRWLPFVQVADVDETVRRAKELRANVITATRQVDGIGRVAVLEAPTGGIFGVVVPKPAPTVSR